MKPLLLLCLAGLCLLSHTRAEEPSTALRLFKVLRFAESARAAAQLSMEPAIKQMQARGLPDPAIAELRLAAAAFLDEVFGDPALQEQMLSVYQNTFTEEEMNQLIAFYSTPVGKKSIEKLPLTMHEGAIIGQRLAAKHSAKFEAQMQAIAAKHQPASEPPAPAPPTPAPAPAE
jgi:uncharacterized protein